MADFTFALATLAEVSHSLRIEIAFLVGFALLWAVSVGTSGKSPRGKVAAPQASKARLGTAVAVQVAGAAANCRDEASIDVRNPTSVQLSDPHWVLAAVQLRHTSIAKALKLYRDALRAGLDLKQMPRAEGDQLFVALLTTAIRAGQVGEALRLLHDARNGPGAMVGLLGACVKVCTSKQLFKESLDFYDVFAEDPAVVLEDSMVWSCLLFCATEAQAYHRCSLYFKQLCSFGVPSGKDYGNMVRCASAQTDWRLSLSLIHDMKQRGLEVDRIVYNTALGTCVAAEQMDGAISLLDDMEGSSGIVDAITYNTLSKGYAKLGHLDNCFELLARMRACSVAPSQVTYGILLDCCINQGRMEKAAEVFNEVTAEGVLMNTVLYTTLIKGFIRAERLDEAMRVYRQMCDDRAKGVTPDLITFSILIKANCDAGHLEEALAFLQAMVSLEIFPDEVIYNNILGGCNDAKLAKQLYSSMVKRGVKPSTATFSILIRLFAEKKMLDEAMDMMTTEPDVRGVDPEPRLYIQLIQACLRDRQGRRAVDVYKLMLRHGRPSVAVHSNLLASCSRLNLLDTAAEILTCAVEHRGGVDVRDAVQLRDVCVRKRKVASVQAITTALACLGVDMAAA